MDATIKDTKQVIFDAYQEALKELKKMEKTKFDPATVKAEKEKNNTLTKASEIVSMNILNAEIIEKYEALNEAIKIKEVELQEYYGIEKEINSILALIESKRKISDEMNNVNAEKRKQWLSEIEELENTHEALKKEISKERKREDEEYRYNLKRQRTIENNEWEDEKAARIKEIERKEADILLKEMAIEENNSKFNEMERIVENMPFTIEEAKKKAVSEKEAEMNKIYAIEKNAIKRELAVEKQLLDQRLTSALELLEKAEVLNKTLNSKLESAYNKINELANASISASQPKIITNNKE